ncbi:MAG: YebC/PmpR family DNA-binding transcriptional regulator [Anaerolineae bacterium]|nr:YebC/PmpR family DNA-binding transcriptional regulator [Anaerolineae bacterium]
MSGHSKWSTIKRKKGAADAKRGQLFTKLAKEIQLAARSGGDPDANFKLRLVLDKAKAANMPKDNVERAIARGTGDDKANALEQVVYEAYAPHGVALLVETLTDNRNRTVAEVRRIFNRMGGSLGESGSVSWIFDQKGYIAVEVGDSDPDEIAMAAIDAGADDVTSGDEIVEVYTLLESFKPVQEALSAAGLNITSAELAMVPKTMIDLGPSETVQAMRVVDALEEIEDVNNVYSNLNISDEVMEQYEGEAA